MIKAYLIEPSELATSVRRLASEAHRTLTSPVYRPARIHALSRRALYLQDQARRRSCVELSSWLAQLQLRLDAAH